MKSGEIFTAILLVIGFGLQIAGQIQIKEEHANKIVLLATAILSCIDRRENNGECGISEEVSTLHGVIGMVK